MQIQIVRKSKTQDGIFGNLSLDWSPFTCYTVENLSLAIPTGVFPVTFYKSPHFGRVMPHLLVPGRTEIMIHWANFPTQLLGCIAVGDTEEPDAVDDSIVTFQKLNGLLSMQEGIMCSIQEAF